MIRGAVFLIGVSEADVMTNCFLISDTSGLALHLEYGVAMSRREWKRMG
ncbi:hypothetical protein TRICHSKD4_2154 [Roseibium sp. TrichSKD4]|nr:hypothetical protein TRICHSKD4_2154 [Roseibium sp. TrichSKD4]